MAVPTTQILIDWRALGLNRVSNGGFETDTSGWSVAAGINAAGTSISRITTDHYLGAACAELVTTATNGSGCNWDFGSSQFVSGRTYRFTVWLKRVSGTTAGKIIIGSEGTPADRANSTFTLTTGWVRYSVDWTPSSTRTDVQLVVTNNAASTLTVRIDGAEVYEALNDVSGDLHELTVTRGANFEGDDTASGGMVLVLRNETQLYDPDNGASTLAGLVLRGRKVWIRAEWAGVTYGLGYGQIERIVLRPVERLIELQVKDLFGIMDGVDAGTGIEELTFASYRAALLAKAGVGTISRGLSDDGPEIDISLLGSSGQGVTGALIEANRATGTAHYVTPDPQSEVLFVYRTKARTELASGSSVETFSGSESGVSVDNYDVVDDAIRNRVFVTPDLKTIGAAATQWENEAVPFMIPAGTVRSFIAKMPGPILASSVVRNLTATGTYSTTPPGSGISSDEVLFAISATTDVTVTAMSIEASLLESVDPIILEGIDQSSINTYGEHRQAVSSDLIASAPAGQGLADWLVYRGKDGPPTPTMRVEGRFPSMLQREVTDRIALTASRLSLSAKQFLISWLSLQIRPLQWSGSYGLEQAPATDTWFTLDTAGRGLDDAAGGTEGKLAY